LYLKPLSNQGRVIVRYHLQIWRSDTQLNDAQHKGHLSDIQHNDHQHIGTQTECCGAECCKEALYAECLSVEFGVSPFILLVLNVIMLNVIMLSVAEPQIWSLGGRLCFSTFNQQIIKKWLQLKIHEG
jgi:hypothetical protein